MDVVRCWFHCYDTLKILGYGDLVKNDAPVWTKSMWNELGHLSQRWKTHAGTDTKKFTLHKDKPKDRKSTYVGELCDTQPQESETHRTRITAGGNHLIEYPGEVSTPTSYLTTMKLHVKSVISDIKYRYMWMDVKYFYLNNCMDRAEYIVIKIYMITMGFDDRILYQGQGSWRINICTINQGHTWTPTVRTDCTWCTFTTPDTLWIPSLNQHPRTMETQ